MGEMTIPISNCCVKILLRANPKAASVPSMVANVADEIPMIIEFFKADIRGPI